VVSGACEAGGEGSQRVLQLLGLDLEVGVQEAEPEREGSGVPSIAASARISATRTGSTLVSGTVSRRPAPNREVSSSGHGWSGAAGRSTAAFFQGVVARLTVGHGLGGYDSETNDESWSVPVMN
jgi:hypothetical protein